MNNKFDINSVINKADAKDRAIIFFDEILNGLIQGKRKFSEAQIESLSNSFKSNCEKDLFNDIQHNSLYSLFSISQVEKEIMSIQYLTTYLKFYNSSQNDKSFIDYLISKTSKDLQKGKNNLDKKQIKKAFDELVKNITESCFISFNDNAIKKFSLSINGEKNTEGLKDKDSDFYDEIFIKFFAESIARKLEIAKDFLEQLKVKNEAFEVKFEVVESKIKDLESSLDKLKPLT